MIYTARVSYRGPDRVDVTRKGGSPFGPSWPLLQHFLAIRRSGKETGSVWADYRAAYLQEMRALYRVNPAPFLALAARDATLVCYCTDAERCHRTLLADILVKLGAEYGGERAGCSPDPAACHRLATQVSGRLLGGDAPEHGGTRRAEAGGIPEETVAPRAPCGGCKLLIGEFLRRSAHLFADGDRWHCRDYERRTTDGRLPAAVAVPEIQNQEDVHGCL